MAGPPVVCSENEALAATAHELRLPLSHIKGFVSALRHTDVEWDARTQREYLAEIELEADRLAALVESLVEAGRPAGPRRPVIDMNFTSPAAVVDGALHRSTRRRRSVQRLSPTSVAYIERTRQ